MFGELGAISFIFRILNSIFFVFLAGYVIKRFIMPGIYENINTQEQNLLDKKQEHEALVNAFYNAEKTIENERLLGTLLTHKVSTWNEQVERQQKHVAGQQEILQRWINERIKKRVAIKTQRIRDTYIAAQAVQQAQAVMVEQFSSEARGMEFIERICVRLEN